MCDFRQIQEIKFLDTGNLLDIREIKNCHATSWDDMPGSPHKDNVKELGFYYIAASGSGYGYYDGKKWLYENSDYVVTKYVQYDLVH